VKKKIFLVALVLIIVVTAIPSFAASISTKSEYEPFVGIEYGYSASVECGTVRYMSQMTSDSYFYDDYWGSWKSRAGYHCSTCSISMALSYIGINKTPLDILNYGNGSVYFGRNWGGAVVSNYTYDKLSAAVDRYCNGNGKYSPVIIHLNKYTSAGHFVIIVGRVSENVYQVLDPSISKTWDITISGSTATYVYPFGTKIITDTIDRTGRTDDIYQWYNANAKLPGYLGECTSYTSYCNVKTTSDIVARSLPCEADVDSTSLEKETVAVDTVCTAVALIKNSIGEYWYKIDGEDRSASYIRADKTEYIATADDDVIIFGATSPDTHIKGKPYPIKGTIASTYTDITSVEAWVCDSTGAVITGGEVSVGGKSYVLNNSTLDYKVIFNDLDLGANTYSIYATYMSYYIDGSNMASYSERVLLYEATFNVYMDPAKCTHSYTETVIKEPSCQAAGLVKYTCNMCNTVYTEEVPLSEHEYGEAVTVKEPTCTERGISHRICVICGYTDEVEIETLPHVYLTEITPPTCTEQGYTTYTCECGDSYVGDYVGATGHSYDSVITPPTESEQGYTTHTCTVCGDSYVDNYTDPIGLRGDLNRDGVVNVDDVIICLDLAFVTPTKEQLETADLDGNGEINVDDVLICLDLCFAV